MIDEVFLLQKETSGTLGATRWLRRCACVHVFGLSGRLCLLRFLFSFFLFFFFYKLTSFIFSGCGITIGYCSLSLTQMGDKDPVCHGRAERVTSHGGKKDSGSHTLVSRSFTAVDSSLKQNCLTLPDEWYNNSWMKLCKLDGDTFDPVLRKACVNYMLLFLDIFLVASVKTKNLLTLCIHIFTEGSRELA